MKSPTRRAVLTGAASLAVAAPLQRAVAQDYPTRNITLVVPFAAGGSTDILARVVAAHLHQALGQPVVIENRTGASGNLGTATVARAAPDGYTFLFNTMSVHTMNHALFANMPFDGVKDFTPIAMLAYVTNTMVIHPSVPAKTVKEFIDYAKANPGKIAYASAGPGSTNHLCAALFEKMTGIQMVHVPYRGGAPAVADTVSGQTQLFFTAGTQSLPHVKAEKLRLLAVTEGRRSSLLPDVPTVAETIPGYEMAVWYGAFGPAGMPPAIVNKLNAEISRIMFLPDVKKRMDDIAVEVAKMTPAELGALTRNDADKWGKLIKELNIAVQ
jgi:tripartite-type tricarboxylate transporter receptor subunit TctC